jgi:hypothetical protein
MLQGVATVGFCPYLFQYIPEEYRETPYKTLGT